MAKAPSKSKGRTHKVAGAKTKAPAFGTPEFRAKYGVGKKSKARKAAGGKKRTAKKA